MQDIENEAFKSHSRNKECVLNVWYNHRFSLHMIKKKNMDKRGTKGIYGLRLQTLH